MTQKSHSHSVLLITIQKGFITQHARLTDGVRRRSEA